MNALLDAVAEADLENNSIRFLVATRCACCAKELKDALSGELGIGPVCRKHYFRPSDVSTKPDWAAGVCFAANFEPTLDTSTWTDARTACNTLIKLYSLDVAGRKWVPEAVYALGYTKLAEKLAQRGGRVEIRPSEDGSTFVIRAPSPGKLMEAVPGMVWHRKGRLMTCPRDTYDALWTAVKLTYPGLLLVTDKGITKIPSA
jgi:hypothetical protein